MTKRLQINIDVTEEEKKKIQENTAKYGFRSVAEYLRMVGINATVEVKINDDK